ncbi:MAG: GyrI-like domain-containing protein [Sedimentisphaerales bacterium]|nr:GyrI-like domain-containing protein [Sedimentisphaerales bacterium]
MEKLDVKKMLSHLYKAMAKKCVIVDVPAMKFLMIDGQGDPNTVPEFHQAMEALYGTAYTAKFQLKFAKVGPEYVVPPLEGLWWMKGGGWDQNRRDLWQWTAMIMQPDHIKDKHVKQAIEELRRKKNPPALDKLRFEKFDEGRCAQVLHIGPYDAEGPTIEKLHTFIGDEGYVLRGKHHEIYMGDPRRTAPEKLKTIIRQPVQMVSCE